MDRGRSRGGRKDDNPSRSRSRSRSRGRDRSRDRPAGARLADKRVYISNIPYDSRWQDIKDLFRKEVGEVAFVELFNDENDKPRGCGIIEFENAPTAKKAIEKMHRFELGGRKIVVKEDYDVERDKTGRIITGSNRNKEERGGGGGGDRDRSRDRVLRDRLDRDWDRDDQGQGQGQGQGSGGKYGNTYGLSQQFLESLGIDGGLIPKVFVSNLDFRVDEKKLKEVFRLAGRVLEVDLNRDKDGKSRGHGVIEFEHPVEAVQAISMFNNQQLYERRMHVKMDRLADPLADLAKNRLPDGLKGIGMGLGVNGQPLVDVSRNLPAGNTNSSVNTVLNSNTGAANQAANTLATSMNTLAAMTQPFGNLASIMSTPQGLDSLGNIGASTAAAMNAQAAATANAFGLAGINPMSALNAPGGQFGNLGGGANSLAAAMQNVGNLGGMQGNPGNNPMSLMGSAGAQIGTPSGMSGAGISAASTPSTQQSPFQTNPGGSIQSGGSGLGMREMDYGYSTSVYSTPSSNYGGSKSNYGNGVSGGNVNVSSGGASASSNTVIVANLPPTCTWQMLKTKFRECGEVVFAEMRDKSTGIVRFATERDAERAVKVFDQSRVDGRIVEVRFL
ncbi:unnamed protein product [Orchesella dallaii]|uniref:RRM domain-containing protein n=1 Tax=Orchesella dallaii TaxID=48710 RepID=A0ABP1QHH5_9HEXA